MKPCNQCGIKKPLSEFDANKKCTTDGHVGHCKVCRRTRQAQDRARIRKRQTITNAANNMTAEEKAQDDFKEKVIRGKEIEDINRIRKLPRNNPEIIFKKLDKVLDAYEKRCNCFSPSHTAAMAITGSDKNY